MRKNKRLSSRYCSLPSTNGGTISVVACSARAEDYARVGSGALDHRSNNAGRVSGCDHKRWDIGGNHCTRANDGPLPDVNSLQNDGSGANKYIIRDLDGGIGSRNVPETVFRMQRVCIRIRNECSGTDEDPAPNNHFLFSKNTATTDSYVVCYLHQTAWAPGRNNNGLKHPEGVAPTLTAGTKTFSDHDFPAPSLPQRGAAAELPAISPANPLHHAPGPLPRDREPVGQTPQSAAGRPGYEPAQFPPPACDNTRAQMVQRAGRLGLIHESCSMPNSAAAFRPWCEPSSMCGVQASMDVSPRAAILRQEVSDPEWATRSASLNDGFNVQCAAR